MVLIALSLLFIANFSACMNKEPVWPLKGPDITLLQYIEQKESPQAQPVLTPGLFKNGSSFLGNQPKKPLPPIRSPNNHALNGFFRILNVPIIIVKLQTQK